MQRPDSKHWRCLAIRWHLQQIWLAIFAFHLWLYCHSFLYSNNRKIAVFHNPFKLIILSTQAYAYSTKNSGRNYSYTQSKATVSHSCLFLANPRIHCLCIFSLLTVCQHYSQCKKSILLRARLTPTHGLLLYLLILPDSLEPTRLKFLKFLKFGFFG